MDDHFSLGGGINSSMELIDSNNINLNSLTNFNLSCGVSSTTHELTPPLPGYDFAVRHHHQRNEEHTGLPFIPLPHDDGTNNNPTFDFSSDHIEAGPFYGHMTYNFPTTTTDDTMIKRRSRDEISLGNSNPPNFISGENKSTGRNNGHGGGKRRKKNKTSEVEKPREVVHVRARRGEATDSHSLAERLRREKINGKLRCLQELVPGCYKTMGMSVMLDITISYIRSLQNQIEFLSMKLSAASMFYDFNSAEMEALDTMRGANGYEGQIMERIGGEGYGDLLQFQPTTWPL